MRGSGLTLQIIIRCVGEKDTKDHLMSNLPKVGYICYLTITVGVISYSCDLGLRKNLRGGLAQISWMIWIYL